MGSGSKNLQKITKKPKKFEKKIEKKLHFFWNFWKFSKSKNRKILKSVFAQRNYFPVPLRPNYIDLHNFLTQNRKKKFLIFLDLEFFSKNFKNFVSNFCGARPHKMLTLMNRSSMNFSVLSPELLWETSWTVKELNCEMLS